MPVILFSLLMHRFCRLLKYSKSFIYEFTGSASNSLINTNIPLWQFGASYVNTRHRAGIVNWKAEILKVILFVEKDVFH